jgi:hypothetical protein
MPNDEIYSLTLRAWTTEQTIRVVVVIDYTLTVGPEPNITLCPDKVEIEVRNKGRDGGLTVMQPDECLS